MDRLHRIFGFDMIEDWIERGSFIDDTSPWVDADLTIYDTPEKRKEIVHSEYKGWARPHGSRMVMTHPNYTLAFIEHHADCVEFESAQIIQKRIRGMIARNQLWSPYTDIGKRRLEKIFNEHD
jgi:hypothetical protein